MKTINVICICLLLLCFILITAGCEHLSMQRRAAYVTKHPELPDTQKDLLLKGKLWVGMKPEEVRACLGSPASIRKDILGSQETWIYIYRDQYLTRRDFKFERALSVEFREGRLADWRED